jgi:hypothetical protein
MRDGSNRKIADLSGEAASRQLSEDDLALNVFQAKTLASYFNEKAQTQSGSDQEHSLELSRLFIGTAMLGTRLMSPGYMPTPEEQSLHFRADQAFKAIQSAPAEMEKFDRYMHARIGEFQVEDPARWERMKRTMPAVTAKAAQYAN